MSQDQRSARAARRAFIKATHPDRGGDPYEFAQQLELQTSHLERGPADSVIARPSRGWRRWLRRWHRRRQRQRAGLPARHLQ